MTPPVVTYYVCAHGHIQAYSAFKQPQWCIARTGFVGTSNSRFCNEPVRQATEVEDAAFRLGGPEAFAAVWKP